MYVKKSRLFIRRKFVDNPRVYIVYVSTAESPPYNYRMNIARCAQSVITFNSVWRCFGKGHLQRQMTNYSQLVVVLSVYSTIIRGKKEQMKRFSFFLKKEVKPNIYKIFYILFPVFVMFYIFSNNFRNKKPISI